MAEPAINDDLDSLITPQPNPDGDDASKETPPSEGDKTPTTEPAPTTEKKPLDGLIDDGEKKDGKEEPTVEKKAPEAYEAFTAPEGYETDDDTLKCVQDACKDLNLAQPEAQKVFDTVAKIHQDGEVKLDKLFGEWEKSSESNPAIMDNLESIKTVLAGFNDTAKGHIAKMGLHKNPDFLLGIAELGKHVTEQAAINGNTQPTQEFDPDKLTKYSDLLPDDSKNVRVHNGK